MRAGGLVVLGLILAAPLALRAEEAHRHLDSVAIDGKPVLRLCRNWMLWTDCKEYGRIALPPLVSVGDSLFVDFGSNGKTIRFDVGAIVAGDGECRLMRALGGRSPDPADRDTDSILVRPCAPPP